MAAKQVIVKTVTRRTKVKTRYKKSSGAGSGQKRCPTCGRYR